MRTTVLICTPDSRSDTFKRCYESLQATTRGIPYDLIIRDNRWNPKFNHAEEIVRTMSSAPEGDFITLDDDVDLCPSWLGDLIEVARWREWEAGIVATTEFKPGGIQWRQGWYCDKSGKPIKWNGDIGGICEHVPAVSSCCMLLTQQAKSTVIQNGWREYNKYYFDIDWCLSCWARGFTVRVIPNMVVHYGGQAVNASGLDVASVLEMDRKTFVDKWITSGELNKIQSLYGARWPMEFKF